MTTLSNWLGFLDVAVALLILGSMQKITSGAGFSSTQAKWALFRRAVHCSMSVALFILGMMHFGDYHSHNVAVCCQTVIVSGLGIFPLLRALGFVTQDQFRGWPLDNTSGAIRR